jgi:LCP family protein required for cell wall assembly
MSDITGQPEPAGPEDSLNPGAASAERMEPVNRRKRRGLRIALVSLASFVLLVGAVAGGGFLYLNHLVNSVQRVPVQFTKLDSANAGGDGGEYGGAMTVLITGEDKGPTGERSISAESASDLIMLLHVNAEGYNGSVVSIPPEVMVNVPGHGRMELDDAVDVGGPTLLVKTVQDLTHVQINHYARIDLSKVDQSVNAMGGVDVDLPDRTDGFGHIFHIGINDLTGRTALDYTREDNLTEEQRVLRQQALIRAVVRKLVHRHLLANPVTDFRVLHAFISMLTLDSNFTIAELKKVAKEIGDLTGSADYVTAPKREAHGRQYLDRKIDRQLWAAIRQDAVAAFAKKYPSTVTPAAPR